MDYDTWLRILNTIANYATAILVLVLVNRDTRERKARRKGGRALRKAMDRVRTERPPVQPGSGAHFDSGVPEDSWCTRHCSEGHTYSEGCVLYNGTPSELRYDLMEPGPARTGLKAEAFKYIYGQRPEQKLTPDEAREIGERDSRSFGNRAEALGWGSQGRRPSSLRRPDQDHAGHTDDRSDLGVPDRPGTEDPDGGGLSSDGKFVTE